MNLDFALILVILTFLTGLVWGLDSLLFRQRRKDRAVRNDSDPHVEPVVVEYSRSLFPVLLIVLLFRSFLFEPFKIPSGSMIPTLLIGDFIVVNKFTYGLRLPVLNSKVVEVGDPQRGDVVVFRYPHDPGVNYIKRVIGLPGETVTYRDKGLFINGEAIELAHAEPSDVRDFICRPTTRERNAYSEPIHYREQLGEVQHDVLILNNERSRNYDNRYTEKPNLWVVPEGSYLMMGDNRDASNDGRSWGFVPDENIVGKAVGIWLNFDFSKGCADWSRVGNGIE
jgi:signal peptidase I